MDEKTIRTIANKPHYIKAHLVDKGWTLWGIDRHYKLPIGTASDTLRNPNRRGEEAISDALGISASKLWPHRYDQVTGHRLSPQPAKSYDRRTKKGQRRKSREAQT